MKKNEKIILGLACAVVAAALVDRPWTNDQERLVAVDMSQERQQIVSEPKLGVSTAIGDSSTTDTSKTDEERRETFHVPSLGAVEAIVQPKTFTYTNVKGQPQTLPMRVFVD